MCPAPHPLQGRPYWTSLAAIPPCNCCSRSPPQLALLMVTMVRPCSKLYSTVQLYGKQNTALHHCTVKTAVPYQVIGNPTRSLINCSNHLKWPILPTHRAISKLFIGPFELQTKSQVNVRTHLNFFLGKASGCSTNTATIKSLTDLPKKRRTALHGKR